MESIRIYSGKEKRQKKIHYSKKSIYCICVPEGEGYSTNEIYEITRIEEEKEMAVKKETIYHKKKKTLPTELVKIVGKDGGKHAG